MSYNERQWQYHEDLWEEDGEEGEELTQFRHGGTTTAQLSRALANASLQPLGQEVRVDNTLLHDQSALVEEALAAMRTKSLLRKGTVAEPLVLDNPRSIAKGMQSGTSPHLFVPRFEQFVKESAAIYSTAEFIGDMVFNLEMGLLVMERLDPRALKGAKGQLVSNRNMSEAMATMGLSAVGDLLSSDLEVACFSAYRVKDTTFVRDAVEIVFAHTMANTLFSEQDFINISYKINRKESISHAKVTNTEKYIFKMNDGKNPISKLGEYCQVHRIPLTYSEEVDPSGWKVVCRFNHKAYTAVARNKKTAKELAALQVVNHLTT